MHIATSEDAISIYKKALEIRDKTPYSFRILANNLEIFKPDSTRLMELYIKYNLENIIALPIFPSEIFSIAYKNIVECPDSNCLIFQKKIYENKRDLQLIDESECQEFFQENSNLLL